MKPETNISFGLMNLDNSVDFMRAQNANVNFNGGGAGNNWVGSLDAGSGANINFGLLNLDNDVDFLRAQDSNVNFNGAGAGNNWVGSLDAGSGANINFGLLNLNTMEVTPLQNLDLKHWAKDKGVQSANFMMHGGSGLVKENIKNGIHFGTDITTGNYAGAAKNAIKMTKNTFDIAKGINAQSKEFGKVDQYGSQVHIGKMLLI